MKATLTERDALRQLGQLHLADSIRILTGETIWTKQDEIAEAMSVPKAQVVVPSCFSSGKFVRASEPVLTPTGWRPIGTLHPGDAVMAADGSATTVVAVYQQGRQQLYRLYLDNGVTVDAGGPHLWAVDREYDGKRQVLTTDEIVARYGGLGAVPPSSRKLQLPMASPAQLPEQPVPLDPYALGLLLGDGGLTQSTPVFSTADPELLSAFTDVRHRSRYDYGVRGISREIAALGLRGLKSHEKFVPESYLWNTPAVRLAVLQGLMDTDGGLSGAGTEYSTSSQKLAEHVLFLVQSLGGRASITERQTTHRPSYRMHLTMPVNPFRLRRKAKAWAAMDSGRKRTKAYTIQRVEQVDIDDAVCIAVDHPDHLFVIGNFIVTHNTWLAARIALALYDAFTPGTPCDICNGPCGGIKIITTSTKDEHLKDNLWGEIRLAWPKIGQRGLHLPGRLWPADTRIENAPNHFITGLVATNPEGFQGYHAPHVVIIGDEATALSSEVATGISGLLASGDARLLLILNPTDGTTYAAAKARSPRTKTIRITAFDTPNFTGEMPPDGANLINQAYLDDMVAEGAGPGTYEWETHVLANFWNLTDDTLISDEWYEDAVSGLNLPMPGSRSIGIDLASYGTAESVIAVRDGLSLVELRAFPSQRVDHFFQGPVTKAIMDYDPHYVIYDADGVGAGAVGYAEALYRQLRPGAQVIPFRGAKHINDHYTNARAMWYWALRRHFESGNINLMVKDSRLREQAVGLRYSISNGAIRVETKDEMKKRGMPSPDRLDALMYAFAYATDLPIPVPRKADSRVDELFGVSDRPSDDHWSRDLVKYDKPTVHPILGVSDW